MARGHQKELARQRNDKNGPGNKPTTQKGTAGKKELFVYINIIFLSIIFLAAALTYQCAVCKVNIHICENYDGFVLFLFVDANGRSKNV